MGYDEALSFKEICRAIDECHKGSAHKSAPNEWYLHRFVKAQGLRRDLRSGRYKVRPGVTVRITRPKPREATAPWFKDRVWQKSMLNSGVYDDLTKSFIYDNMACQKGKGTDLAIRRVIAFLQKLYRKDPAAPIYGVHLDVKKYFPSTPHKVLKQMDKRIISDTRFLPYLEEIIDSTKDKRSEAEISLDPFGERGTGLGSHINQLHQVALLSYLDHDLKAFCRYYLRYNDDFLILDHDIECVKKARDVIGKHLQELGLTMTDKSGIFVVQRSGFEFLRKRFILKPSGKIILRMHKKALADERRALRALKRKMDAGEKDMAAVKRHYQSWIAYAEYAGDAPIRAMDRYYRELFKESPEYKRKKRYLYGKQKKIAVKRSEGKDAEAAAGKRSSESGK